MKKWINIVKGNHINTFKYMNYVMFKIPYECSTLNPNPTNKEFPKAIPTLYDIDAYSV